MNANHADELIVGIIAAAAVPWILWILRRALRDGQLAIRKAQVSRWDRPAAFNTLFVFYVVAALLMTFVAADLLFDLRLKEML